MNSYVCESDIDLTSSTITELNSLPYFVIAGNNSNKLLLKPEKDEYTINERTRSIEIENTKKLVSLIKKNCKQFLDKQLHFYRGVGKKYVIGDYILDDPEFETDLRKEHKNKFHTLFCTYLPSWDLYPSRKPNECNIASYSKSIAFGYTTGHVGNEFKVGDVYCCIPYDDAMFGMTPGSDFWFSFNKKLKAISEIHSGETNLQDFNNHLAEWFTICRIKVDDTDWNSLKNALIRIDKSAILSEKLFNHSDVFTYYHDNMHEGHFENLLDFFDWLYNPEDARIQSLPYTSMPTDKNRKSEVWTESPLILIKETLFDKVILEF
jgi:hypothetical protein